MFSKIASIAGAAAVIAGTMIGLSAPAQAESAPGCGPVTPIGSTAYIKSGGVNIGSVKQFKGCNKNWAYVFVWEGFRSTHSNWEVCVSVATGKTAPFSLEGLQCHSKKAENWSEGTPTLNKCTHAVGNIRWGGNEPSAKTSIRC